MIGYGIVKSYVPIDALAVMPYNYGGTGKDAVASECRE